MAQNFPVTYFSEIAMLNFSNQPPSEDDLDVLHEFLASKIADIESLEGRDPGICGISQLDGFFTAVVSGPDMIPPSRWMKEVWGDIEAVFDSEDEASNLYGTMFRMMNANAGTLMEEPSEFEPMFAEFEDEPGEDFVDFWCSGYMRGVALWDELPRAGKDLDHLLLPILTNSAYSPEEISENVSEEDRLLMKRSIPVCARLIHQYWLERRDEFMPGGPIRKEQKAGANEPCPCGSGLKYKKCCMN